MSYSLFARAPTVATADDVDTVMDLTNINA
jgi:hypothetical protein